MYSSAGHPQQSQFNMEASFHQMMSTINSMNSKMDTFMGELKAVNNRLIEVESDVKSAYSEIFKLKDQVNYLQQDKKALTIRIFGVPVSDDEKASTESGKAAAKTAYDRILKPILSAAKDKALISTLPQRDSVISEAFRVNQRPTSANNPNPRPPPIIIKLSSHAIKVALFKSRRDAIPDPTETEKAAGLKRFHMVEDLTAAAYNCMMELRANDKVERCWSTDGEIRFTKTGDSSNYVYKVKSVFDNISLILS